MLAIGRALTCALALICALLDGALAQETFPCRNGVVVRVDTPGQIIITATGKAPIIVCTWLVGRPGFRAAVQLLDVDGDPGLSYASLYDGPTAASETLLIRSLGRTPMLPPPVISSSTYLTLNWHAEINSYSGRGLRANVSFLPAPVSPAPPPPLPLLPITTVTTAEQLLSAASDLRVTAVTVTANIRLLETARVIGLNRNLSVRGTCSPACRIDCGGSCHAFEVMGGAKLSLADLVISGGLALQGGAAVAAGPGSRIDAARVTFSNNTAWGDGGALLGVDRAVVTCTNCTFNANTARGGGGAGAAVLYGASLNITRSTFRDNTAITGPGGGVFAQGSGTRMFVGTSTFYNHHAGGYGGSIAALYFARTDVEDVDVRLSWSFLDGGCIHGYFNDLMTISRTHVADCSTSDNGFGGGITVEFQSSVITDTVLDNSTCSGGAGGILLWNGTLSASNLTVTRAVTRGTGGGLWATLGSSVVCTDCHFEDNVARRGGGAICTIDETVLTITGGTFTNNVASAGGGGAVSFDGQSAELVILNSNFTGNSAPTNCGGGVYIITGAHLQLYGNNFIGNEAASGGGVCYPVTQHLALCGDPANTLSGDVGPVKIGQLLPLKLDCKWTIPDGMNVPSNCAVEIQFNILNMEQTVDVMTLIDRGTGAIVYRVDNTVEIMPPKFRSTGNLGFDLTFTADQSPGNYWLTGFAASYATVCDTSAGRTTSDVVSIWLQNQTFVGNHATNGDGGALMVTLEPGSSTDRDTFLTLTNVKMENNWASAAGGGAFLGLSTELDALNLRVAGNVARGGAGGGIAVDEGGWVNITSSDFTNNAALSGKGGGLSVVASTSATLVSASFKNCTSAGDGGGGGMFIQRTPLIIDANTFDSNTAEGDGGGFFAQDGTEVLISKSSFVRNVATGKSGRGGGVSLANVTRTVIGSTGMINNAAVDKAIAARLGVDTVVRYRAGDGGGFFSLNPNPDSNSTVSLSGVTILGNVALSAGGGIAAWGAIDLSMSNCTVRNNGAYLNGGGAALGLGVRLASVHSNFTLNHAGSNALLFVPESPVGALLEQSVAQGTEAVATCAASSGGPSEGSAGDGGGLWVFGGSSVVLRDCDVSSSTALGGGAAVYVGIGSAASLQAVLLSSNAAPFGAGGAVLLSGAGSSLSAHSCNVSHNEAFIGGFLGFERGATSLSSLSLRSLILDGNRAQAGALYGVRDSAAPFTEPACVSCRVSNNQAVSYGQVSATPPTDMSIQFPTAARTGDSGTVNSSLTDGFGQHVANFTGLLGELECISQMILRDGAPPVVRSCSQSALRGSIRAPYQDGVARFSPVFVSGEPRSVFTLAVTFVALPGDGVTALLGEKSTSPFNVTVAPCKYLERFDGVVYGSNGTAGAIVSGSDLCGCAAGAIRDAKTGECTCGPNYALAGPPPGSAAALRDPGAATCLLLAKVQDDSAQQRRVTIIATVCTVIPLVLLVVALAAYWVAVSRRVSEQTIQQLIIPEEALAIVVWGDGTLADSTTEFLGGEFTTSDIIGSLPPSVRASTLLKAVRVTFRGTRVWVEQAAVPAPNRRSSTGIRTNFARRLSQESLPADGPRVAGRTSVGDFRNASDRSEVPIVEQRISVGSTDRRASTGGRIPSGIRRLSEYAAAQRRSQQSRLSRPKSLDEGNAAAAGPPSVGGSETQSAATPGAPTGSSLSELTTSLHQMAPIGSKGHANDDQAPVVRKEIGHPGGLSGARSERRGGIMRQTVHSDWLSHNLVLLCSLRHPAIVTTYGAADLEGHQLLVREYMSFGNLEAVLSLTVIELEMSALMKIATDVVSGCRYLHERDPPIVAMLTSRNIFIEENLRAKIKLGPEMRSEKRRLINVWAAPEVLQGQLPTPASDVYAFGIILYELMTREEPYGGIHGESHSIGEESAELFQNVVAKDSRPEFPMNTPVPAVREVACDCWHRNASRRPTFAEVDRAIRTAFQDHLDEIEAKGGPSGPGATSENLLRDVFPEHVVKTLQAGKKVEPESFDAVTIFFSDIVGFTDISGKSSPEEVMSMLDRLYTKLDALATKYGLFKVETIGDAFMCCGGLPEYQPDHTLRVAKFAIEAVSAANSVRVSLTDPSEGFINIRVGFHCGSVVASVVGTVRPRYCLFGDTVNTSSRMESMSIANHINMSKAAADELQLEAPGVRLISRGLLDIKGKGRMECFFLEDTEASRETLLAATMSEERQEAALAKRKAALAKQDLHIKQQKQQQQDQSSEGQEAPRAAKRGK